MGSFEEMELKKRLMVHITGALERVAPFTKTTWATGRTMGLKIPEDIRTRLEAQAKIWELGPNFKITVMTAIMLGLDQMEHIHELKGKEPTAPRVFGTNGSREL